MVTNTKPGLRIQADFFREFANSEAHPVTIIATGHLGRGLLASTDQYSDAIGKRSLSRNRRIRFVADNGPRNHEMGAKRHQTNRTSPSLKSLAAERIERIGARSAARRAKHRQRRRAHQQHGRRAI